MPKLTTCFLALEPDEKLTSLVLGHKRKVRELVGEQQFLNDPPHSTLYLASYSDTDALASQVAQITDHLSLPVMDLVGWHVFPHDHLTGKDTLVCSFTEASKQEIRKLQRQVIEVASPLRDVANTRARYDDAWDRLSAEECDSIENWGFPYIGGILQPHVTIASIAQQAWPTVWKELESLSPSGQVGFPAICLYALQGEQPVLLRRHALRRKT